MKVELLKQLGNQINSQKTLADCIQVLKSTLANIPEFKTGDWRKYLVKLINYLENPMENKGFSIIALKGNSKLPFACFSSLAIFSCPGAGDCKTWCYSVKAWRYPAAFYRQMQNTLLMRYRTDLIVESFLKLPENVEKFRLYVDGDFESIEQVEFWFHLIRNRPNMRVYGYSKSWDEIHGYFEQLNKINGSLFPIPANYVLNLSGGGKIRNTSKETMLSLPITRGEFIAVPLVKNKVNSGKRFSLPEYHQETRTIGNEITGKKVFSCPGSCGSCSNGSHACGSMSFKGIPIAIGIH